MNVLILGGSRNIGYESSLRILASGGTVTYLLRRADTFDDDEVVKKYKASGNVKMCVGDAMKEDDVQKAWEMAGAERSIDFIVFSIGGVPKMHITKGAIMDPPNLCAASLLNLLATWPRDMTPQPKLIAVTSNGLTKKSYKALPLPSKALNSWMLRMPHADKLGMERLLFEVMGRPWIEDEPAGTILPSTWKSKIGGGKWLEDVIIVRPALLTSGNCAADKKGDGAYRVGPEDLKSAWTVSRKDTAHFITMKAMPNFSEYKGKCVTIAY